MMFIGHQKGRDLKRGPGIWNASSGGLQKSARLLRLAEKFSIPVVTLVDTPGAYPGIGAEERGQSEAIGNNLFLMAGLKFPL